MASSKELGRSMLSNSSGLVWRCAAGGWFKLANRSSDMSDEVPVACCLSDEELRNREATLLAQFKSAVVATEQLADGYAFQVPGDKKSLALVLDLILAERECCPFLMFQFTAAPKMGATTLRVTGPAGTKEFLRTILL